MLTVVTGAAGFIGSHVVEALLQTGHRVFGIDNLSRGRLSNLTLALRNPQFAFEQLDLSDDESLIRLFKSVNPEAVCHLAAQIDVRTSVRDPILDAQQNVLNTIRLLEAMRTINCKRMIFSSSGGSIYGQSHDLPVSEDAPLSPGSQYAASKAAGELYLTAYAALYGLEWVSLALSNVYGPRQDPDGEAGVVTIFARALLSGAPSVIFGAGHTTRDYVNVADVAQAFASACTALDVRGRRLNIGTGVETTVADLYAQLQRITGSNVPADHGPERLGELRRSALDATEAERALHWRPSRSLVEGLTETVEWLRQSAMTPM